MKKILYFLCGTVCCVFFICILPVKADVIWAPEDSFFKKHSEECEYVGRTYTANGPDGEVILYKSPESSKVIDRWKNGKQIQISFLYKDERGIVWGANESLEDKAGWAPMEYMQAVFDSIAFKETYAAEITEESGSLGKEYQGKSICIWDYPGAKNCFSAEVSKDMELPVYDKIYRDKEGRKWGNVEYYYGYDDVWICLDFPKESLEELYPEGPPEYEMQEEEKEFTGERIVPKTDHRTIICAAVVVCIVVLVTAFLLTALRRKGTEHV